MNGLYLAASGAASQLDTLDTVANNLANAGTAGFRRVLSQVESIAGDGSYLYASAPATPLVDMGQGPLKATGNPLDVAVTGPAFMVVDTPNGPAYTRNGELQVDPDGTLTTAGYPLEKDGGGPIVLPQGSITIASDGTINVNGATQAKIGLADPAGDTLTPLGGTLYRNTGPDPLPASTGGSQIHQGFIEGSAMSETGELVNLIGVMRSYEASMKAVKSIDDNQNQTIQAYTIQS
ncbi:MAG: flagellar hook-basal body complex protein [Candidatus Binatales bacterium]